MKPPGFGTNIKVRQTQCSTSFVMWLFGRSKIWAKLTHACTTVLQCHTHASTKHHPLVTCLRTWSRNNAVMWRTEWNNNKPCKTQHIETLVADNRVVWAWWLFFCKYIWHNRASTDDVGVGSVLQYSSSMYCTIPKTTEMLIWLQQHSKIHRTLNVTFCGF